METKTITMETQKYPKDCWYVVGMSDEFEKEELKNRVVAGSSIVIWRTKEGKVVAFDNRCCHKRFPLSESRLLDNGLLECAYHGLCYDDSGKCVKIPSVPDKPIPERAKLRPVKVIEQDTLVWVWVGNPERAHLFTPPRTPEIADKEWSSVHSEVIRVPANFLLIIENLLDITHFYPLHEGNIGDYANSLLPIDIEEGEEGGYQYVRTVRNAKNYKQPPFFIDWFHFDNVDRSHTHCMVTPALTRVELKIGPTGKFGSGLGGGGTDRGYILFHTHTPIDNVQSDWRWYVCCPADHKSLGDPTKRTVDRIAEMFPSVVDEDKWALERQQKMIEIPDEGYTELFLHSDTGLRRARQIISQMIREEKQPSAQTA